MNEAKSCPPKKAGGLYIGNPQDDVTVLQRAFLDSK
jgi:hypothetical protein